MRTMEESIEQKAQERADRKLQYIIGRYGDANGERRKPYYRELGHTTTVLRKNSKCVSMLVDEEFLFRNGLQPNLIGCYLYETDKHRSPIMGNILFVGNAYVGDGVEFTGIEPETFETLHKQLKNMAMAMKAHKEALGV